MRGTHRFGIKGKLAPRYVGPFRILSRRGPVAYRLELPPNLSQVHDVFHVSQLRRCFKDPIREVEHDMIELQKDLTYQEHPSRILDQSECRFVTPSLSVNSNQGYCSSLLFKTFV